MSCGREIGTPRESGVAGVWSADRVLPGVRRRPAGPVPNWLISGATPDHPTGATPDHPTGATPDHPTGATPDHAAGAAAGHPTGADGQAAGDTGDPSGAAGVVGPGWCPWCAVRTVLRGDRDEVTHRAAEAAADILVMMRGLLEHHDPTHTPTNGDTTRGGAPPGPPPTGADPEPRVQRIPVQERTGR